MGARQTLPHSRDANNVMIFGPVRRRRKVSTLLGHARREKGLFQRAAIESGAESARSHARIGGQAN